MSKGNIEISERLLKTWPQNNADIIDWFHTNSWALNVILMQYKTAQEKMEEGYQFAKTPLPQLHIAPELEKLLKSLQAINAMTEIVGTMPREDLKDTIRDMVAEKQNQERGY
jgi:hypothetical protein